MLGVLCDQACTRESGTQGFDVFLGVPLATHKMNNHLPQVTRIVYNVWSQPMYVGAAALARWESVLNLPAIYIAGFSLTANGIFSSFSVLDPFQEEQNLATLASEWTPNFESKA